MAITAAEITVEFEGRGAGTVAAEIAGVDKAVSGVGGSAGRAAPGVQTLSRGLSLLGIGAGIAAGFAVNAAGDFEQSFLTMGAVADVPASAMNELRQVAQEAGAATVFSANEAAESMLNLAKAGLTTAQITGGALGATLALAAAGSVALADAATITANALNTFNLRGKDAGMVADALAGAANASSADVSDLAMALQQGGTAANMAGLSVQETTAALAALADQGIRGSDAGTSLKTMLLNLNPVTARQKSTMTELGISFIKANGEFKDLEGIAGELRGKLSGLTQSQRLLALETIFGSDAIRAANTLYEEGASGIRGYQEATSEQGTAAEVAAARMSGFKGALEALKGSVETLAMSAANALLPALTGLANVATTITNFFLGLPGPAKKVIGVLAAMTAAVLALAATRVALGGLTGAFKELKVIQEVGSMITPLKTMLTGLATTFTTAAAAAGGGLAGLTAGMGAVVAAALPVIATIAAVTAAIYLAKEAFTILQDAHQAEADLMASSIPAIKQYGESALAAGDSRDELSQRIENEIEWLKKEGANEIEVARARIAGITTLKKYDTAINDSIGRAAAYVQSQKKAKTAAFSFAGMTAEKFYEWEAETRDAFGGAGSALARFAGKTKVSLSKVTGAIDKQIREQKEFGRNYDEVIDRGIGKKFPALAQTIQEGGLEMAGVVKMLADANSRDFNRVGRSMEKTETLGQRLSTQLGTALMGFSDKTGAATDLASSSWMSHAGQVELAAQRIRTAVASIPSGPGGSMPGTAGPNQDPGLAPKMAHGGVVTKRTLATVGEAGREAVIPLTTDRGADYLARAMQKALGGDSRGRRQIGGGGSIINDSIVLSIDGRAVGKAQRRREILHGGSGR